MCFVFSPGNHDECVRIFLQAGGGTEIQDHTGTFPIHITSQDNRRCTILTMLCESFANLDQVDQDNQTALHLAAIANVPEVCALLLGNGASPHIRDATGCQPVHLASRHGSVASLHILMEYDCDMNLKNWDGINAIGEARMNNQTEIVALFEQRYVLSSVVARQREETLAMNLGIPPPLVVPAVLNIDALKPGNHVEQSVYWKQVLSRSLKYRSISNWVEYREVLPPKEWILEQRMNKTMEYDLKHWWENIDTGACTFMCPETILLGEWMLLDECIQKETNEGRKKEIQKKVQQWQEKEEENNEETNTAADTTSTTTSAGSVIWINQQTDALCKGLPPTALSVSSVKQLEPRCLPENVKEESLSLVDYQVYYKKEKQLLDEMALQWSSCLTIQTHYRGYRARCVVLYMKQGYTSAVVIQKHARGVLSREQVRIQLLMLTTTVTLQKRRRGCVARRYLKWIGPQLHRRKRVVQANHVINRVWRGYLARRQRRRMWWQQIGGPTTNTEWQCLRNTALIEDTRDERHESHESHDRLFRDSSYLAVGSVVVRSNVLRKYDCLCVGSGWGCNRGSMDRTWDVFFWYNKLKGTFSWATPKDVAQMDRNAWKEQRELRLRGFTTEQQQVAEKLQAIWRGKQMVVQFRIILQATKIMKTCEDDYMAEPTNVAKTCNYMLYVHLFPPHDLERARSLYTKAMAKMQERGPDHSFILYSFLIYVTATQEEDDAVLWELHRRAKAGKILFYIFNGRMIPCFDF